MAYFLKKSNYKKGRYLQIYESFYDPERGHTAHCSHKPIGYVHELQAQGINDKLSVKKYIDLMQSVTDFRFIVRTSISKLTEKT